MPSNADPRFIWQALCFQLVWQHEGPWPERDIGQRMYERQRGDSVVAFMAARAKGLVERGEAVDSKPWRVVA